MLSIHSDKGQYTTKMTCSTITRELTVAAEGGG